MLKVGIAGGSIGGLCTGAVLRAIGCDVQIHERAHGPLTGRGAGIVAQPQLLQLFQRVGAPELPTTSCRYRRHLGPDGDHGDLGELPLRLTSWSAIYRTLKAAFPEDSYYSGSTLSGFEQAAGAVLARFDDGNDARMDLLVCADGSRSEMRRLLEPEIRPRYAGYVAWRGTLEEEQAPPEIVRFFDRTFTVGEGRSGGHILCYVIPGADAATEDGQRHLNWVWYVRISEGPQLDRLMTDKKGKTHAASVSAGMVPAGLIAEMQVMADRELHPRFVELVRRTSDPFLQAIVDVDLPRMAFGRVCLLGDAAFVLRPHPAAATAKAAADAMALADALRAHATDLSAALHAWNARQIAYGSALAEQARVLGIRTVGHNGGSRTLTDLRERFRGISPELPLA